MTEHKHVLEIYEPYDYEGANPLNVDGIAVLSGPLRDNYYLVRLESPFCIDRDTNVECLLLQPRYTGDKIDRAVCSGCTVNIARVTCDTNLADCGRVNFDDFERWGVGKINPLSA